MPQSLQGREAPGVPLRNQLQPPSNSIRWPRYLPQVISIMLKQKQRSNIATDLKWKVAVLKPSHKRRLILMVKRMKWHQFSYKMESLLQANKLLTYFRIPKRVIARKKMKKNYVNLQVRALIAAVYPKSLVTPTLLSRRDSERSKNKKKLKSKSPSITITVTLVRIIQKSKCITIIIITFIITWMKVREYTGVILMTD